jgi:hypothetical protein
MIFNTIFLSFRGKVWMNMTADAQKVEIYAVSPVCPMIEARWRMSLQASRQQSSDLRVFAPSRESTALMEAEHSKTGLTRRREGRE